MISLLHSGKFWLKLIVFSCLTLLLLLVIDIAVLQYLFNAEKIQKHVDMVVAKNGQQVVFDQDISRSLFPRPTVTLHNLRLNNSTDHSEIALVKTVKIGLGWQSLFGKPVVEKLQLFNAQINLIQSPQGQWNLQNLFEYSDSADRLHVNRFIVENAHISIQNENNLQQISNLNLQFSTIDNNSSALQSNGLLSGNHLANLNFQINGIYRPHAAIQWQDVKLNIETELPWLGKSTGQWSFDARLNSKDHLLQTGHVQWQWQSQQHQFHISGTGQNWKFSFGTLLLPQITGVATAQFGENNVNTTLTASNANWSKNQWSIEQFQIDSGWQNNFYQTALTFNGQLSWQDTEHWLINNLSINSHQDSVNQLPNSRFISDLNGTVEGDKTGNTQINLQGQFDNQPLSVSLNYHKEGKKVKLSGIVNLAQLNLRPYLENPLTSLPENWQNLWQKWFKNRIIELQFNTNVLQTLTVQFNQVKSTLTADAENLTIDPLNLHLYGGETTGMLHISNSIPMSWKTKQHVSDIQIKSFMQDMFGFNNLDGQGDVDIDLHSSGISWKKSLANITGNAKIQIRKGVWNGIDINNILQHSDNQNALSYNETNYTPFQSIKLNLPINNSFTENSHLQLHADNFDIKGNGNIKWQQQQMDFNVLVATRRGNSLNYLPLRINGTFKHPSFTIDYQRLTAGLHTSKQKHDTLRQTLQQQWQWLNQGASSDSEANNPANKP